MPTRFYFPSTGTPAVIPTSWGTGWNFQNAVTNNFPLSTAKALTNSKSLSITNDATSTARFGARMRFISPPLSGQTISGTIKGQIRALEATATNNATIAVAIHRINLSGVIQSTLLNPIAATGTATPPELATSLTNRPFSTAAGIASVPIVSKVFNLNDRLVIEIGVREIRNAGTESINIGDDNSTDLPENSTTTILNNPWIEFSSNIQFNQTSNNLTLSSSAKILVSNTSQSITLGSNCRIIKPNLKTLNLTSRIQSNKNILLSAGQRLQASKELNFNSNGRLQQYFSKLINANNRIQKNYINFIATVARNQKNGLLSIISILRIQKKLNILLVSNGRTQISDNKKLSFNSRIQKNSSILLSSNLRNQNSNIKDLNSLSRQQVNQNKYLNANCQIVLVSTTKSLALNGLGRLQTTKNITLNTSIRLQLNLNKYLTTQGRTENKSFKNLNCSLRGQTTKNIFLDSNLRLQNLFNKTLQSTNRNQVNRQIPLTSSCFVTVVGNTTISQFIIATGRIQNQKTTNINSNSRILTINNKKFLQSSLRAQKISEKYLISNLRTQNNNIKYLSSSCSIIITDSIIKFLNSNFRVQKNNIHYLISGFRLQENFNKSINGTCVIVYNKQKYIFGTAQLLNTQNKFISSNARIYCFNVLTGPKNISPIMIKSIKITGPIKKKINKRLKIL